MAAAVAGGRATPGSRKTARCEKGLGLAGVVAGIAYRKDVGVGADVGAVSSGWPLGRRPNKGWLLGSAMTMAKQGVTMVWLAVQALVERILLQKRTQFL